MEPDDVDVPAAGAVIGLGDVGELGGHPQGAVGVVPEAVLGGHAHAALAHVQVQQLIDVRAVFQQNIFAGHAHVGGAALHIHRNVRGLDPEVADLGLWIFKDQLALGVQQLVAGEPGFGEHLVHPFAQAALGQGHVQKLTHAFAPPLRSRISFALRSPPACWRARVRLPCRARSESFVVSAVRSVVLS